MRDGVSIVPGDIRTGRFGLWGTVRPSSGTIHPGVIVDGHGVFTAGGEDFNEAFGALLAIEQACRRECFRRVRQ